eukprot:2911075-Heterocapsa_arctica.AAC.2
MSQIFEKFNLMCKAEEAKILRKRKNTNDVKESEILMKKKNTNYLKGMDKDMVMEAVKQDGEAL